MGDRAECPACKAFSSGVYADLHYNYTDCQYCGCPHALLVQWDEMQSGIEDARERKTTKDLAKTIEVLFCENAVLKAKFKKMEDILAWRNLDELFDPFIKIKKILEDS
jgi:hypothetical protein